ncbi:hypothetical protein FTUN_2036 [Frigoriglobus tundricola]|uniref:Uncharacterized protein n=1 Tax=Frigoriglobus tundricola TaxID=2774151 RepID=A0A6M5YKP1_9BACT|nr:hypothetical protein FTUN_2036 [Frigoriglobus tundricola]
MTPHATVLKWARPINKAVSRGRVAIRQADARGANPWSEEVGSRLKTRVDHFSRNYFTRPSGRPIPTGQLRQTPAPCNTHNSKPLQHSQKPVLKSAPAIVRRAGGAYVILCYTLSRAGPVR